MKARGKRKTQDPCQVCGLHKNLCICTWIPRLNLRTKIVLVIHHKELRRTTNSGQLAVHALSNSEVFIRGQDRSKLDLSKILIPEYQTFLFYPDPEALPLTSEFVQNQKRPLQLIIPDGNWRQASKVASRHPELKDIPRVMIKKPNLATQHLRRETSSIGMSTLQAIAEALGIIEGPDVGNALMNLYEKKLEHTLKGRPQISR